MGGHRVLPGRRRDPGGDAIGRVLVYADNYDDAWRVAVDGEPRELLVANVTNKAVFVPKGEHVVRFRYAPWLYIVSFWIRVLFVIGAFCAWAIMLVAGRWRRVTRATTILSRPGRPDGTLLHADELEQ